MSALQVMVRRPVWLVLLILSAGSAGCMDRRSRQIVNDLRGALENHTRLEAYLPKPPAPGSVAYNDYDHGPVVSGPVSADNETAKQISDVFLDPRTYGWEESHRGRTKPTVKLVIHHGERKTWMLLSFNTSYVMISDPLWAADFDKSSHRLRALILRLFPENSDL